MTAPSRVLTGDRPTGPLHLGHYFGTLANRLRLQAEGHDLFIVIADYQVIADRERPGELPSVVLDLVLDYLAIGLDPERTTIFTHSAVPALNQLMLPFLSLVSVAELHRNPTIKQEIAFSGQSSMSGLMLTYPVHQAADILFCQADMVPVGQDQLPHIELTRQIARRFNQRYGPTFRLPSALLGQAPVLLGMDGRKMGKSLRNGIALRSTHDEVVRALRSARTDSERSITFEPERRPEIANLLTIAALCSGSTPTEVAAAVGAHGAGGLKQEVIDRVDSFLDPIRQRRAELAAADAEANLSRGIDRANELADATLRAVNSAMGMTGGTRLAAPQYLR
jgi:tryptophanyl-tRNA synthetase